MKLDALRKLIREEMRTVIQEELKGILTEAVIIASTPDQKPQQPTKPYINLKSNVKSGFNEVLASERNIPTSTGNPLLDLLNETAQAGEWKSLNGDGYNASDAVSWVGGMPGGSTPVVATVDEMISRNKHAQDITQVSIDAVPDFSKIMGKMKENGTI
jgi:hypothetical protein